MNLVRLALRNITGSPFRSGLVFLCVALVAGCAVWATLVVQGARENLRLSMAGTERLGADIVVVPRGSGASNTGNVDLAGSAGGGYPADLCRRKSRSEPRNQYQSGQLPGGPRRGSDE